MVRALRVAHANTGAQQMDFSKETSAPASMIGIRARQALEERAPKEAQKGKGSQP